MFTVYVIQGAMNIIKESNPLNGANEKQFLENTMLNLLAANQFGKLMTYYADKANETTVEYTIMSSLLNDAQQNELY